MDQVTTGLRRILEIPVIYKAFINLLGDHSARKRFIGEFVKPFSGARVLDIGCGPGDILEYFPDNIKYVGCDMNPKYIQYAQNRFKDRAEFLCARVNELHEVPLKDSFDIVLAKGLLHHLNDEEAGILFECGKRNLKEGGVFISYDCVYIPNQPPIARYIISKDRGQHIRTPEQYEALAAKQFASIDATIVTDFLRVPYTHFIMRCTRTN